MTDKRRQEDEFAIHVSAIMSGLMVVFLFVAITYIQNVELKNEEAKDIVENFQEVKEEIVESIKLEFMNEFGDWNALVDPATLSFQFNSPEVLFKAGQSDLTSKFKEILDDFFPRYIEILKNEEYKEYISAIQIEGHTSSEWGSNTEELIAYINNMDLSQERSAEVLKYVLNMNNIGNIDSWTRNRISAIGYSSSQLKYKEAGGEIQELIEDKGASRRVAFRIVTDAELRLDQISEANI